MLGVGICSLLFLTGIIDGPRLASGNNGVENLSFDLAVNTAVSFVTNTNWQAYAGEVTLSNTTQMLGLTVQNFLSATVGLAVLCCIDPRHHPKEIKPTGEFLARSST